MATATATAPRRPAAEPAAVLDTGTDSQGRAYAVVSSASEPGAVRVVTFLDTRAGRVYRCTCPGGTFRPGSHCRHVVAAVAEWQRQARDMADYCRWLGVR